MPRRVLQSGTMIFASVIWVRIRISIFASVPSSHASNANYKHVDLLIANTRRDWSLPLSLEALLTMLANED